MKDPVVKISPEELREAVRYWVDVLKMTPPKYCAFQSFDHFTSGWVAGRQNQKVESLWIGEYEIFPKGKNGYWIYHKSGEGMEVPTEKFEKFVSDWYKENF